MSVSLLSQASKRSFILDFSLGFPPNLPLLHELVGKALHPASVSDSPPHCTWHPRCPRQYSQSLCPLCPVLAPLIHLSNICHVSTVHTSAQGIEDTEMKKRNIRVSWKTRALFSERSACILSRSVVSNSLWPLDCSLPGFSVHGIFSGKNTGVACHFLLQETLLIPRSNPHLLRLLHCRWIPYPLSHQGVRWEMQLIKLFI